MLHALSISLHRLPNVALHNILVIVVRVILIVTILHVILDHRLLHLVKLLVRLLTLHVVKEPHLLVLESLILGRSLSIRANHLLLFTRSNTLILWPRGRIIFMLVLLLGGLHLSQQVLLDRLYVSELLGHLPNQLIVDFLVPGNGTHTCKSLA